MADNKWVMTQGSANVSNASQSAVLLAAPGANKANRIAWGMVTVSTAATGGGGTVSLKDGSTLLHSFPAAAVGSFNLQWGDDGYVLSTNGALNLTCEGAVTNQATAQCTITGYKIG